jgi:tripartite-type tricarboxylate transporter receptor subunit TctC
MNPRTTARLLVRTALAGLALVGAMAHAQAWPDRPLKIIVPAGAGAAPDIIARLIGERLSAALGQGVVVDNKPEAGGIPGMSTLARSAPDGYTIGFVPAAMGTITPLVFKNPQFSPEKDLQSVATVGISPLMMVVAADKDIKSLKDLEAHAKARPGKVNFAAPQLNSLPYLAGEMVSKMGQMDLATIPFRSQPEALATVLGGDAIVSVDGVPGVINHVRAGRLRAIAVTSKDRLPGIDVPTVAETYPGYEVVGWFQIIVPAGTPAAIVERLNTEVNRITAAPEMVARMNDMGVYPRQHSVADSREFFTQQQAAMKRLVNTLGIQAQ